MQTRGTDFRSDNTAGIAPQVLRAIADIAEDSDAPYGEDAVTQGLTARLSDLFETEVAVFPVGTGTAANALALSALTPPWGAVCCHAQGHILTSEGGAPEFYSGGAKLIAFDGHNGRIAIDGLADFLTRASPNVHQATAHALSISQVTEAGTVYAPDEIKALGALCARHGLKFHMDGARLGNAVAALGCSPAEVTWKAGVDVLSFGLTKVGAISAEAVVFFDRALAADFAARRKRGGHLFSKMRFLSVQIEAMLKDGLWLELARHMNTTARYLAEQLSTIAGLEILYPVEANALYVHAPEQVFAAVAARGYRLLRRDLQPSPCVRLMTSFNTGRDEIDGLVAAFRDALL
jgi:threonine aldolase